MTGEEMERAIEFLLKSQANFEERQVAFEERQVAFEAQQRRTDEQIAETGRQVAHYAETQSVFIETVTRVLEAQDQINASLRAADARTDERLNKLIGLFEQHIVAGH